MTSPEVLVRSATIPASTDNISQRVSDPSCRMATTQSCSLLASDRSVECVLGIAAARHSQYETTVDPILSRMVALCNKRLKLLWLDDQISSREPERWDPCDILWTLYTPDLPLNKVKAYVDRVKPLELNDVAGLMMVTNRSTILKQCVKYNIAVPKYVECCRDNASQPAVEDAENHIVVDGKKIDKPFLEKPCDANDHDIYIYMPKKAGGGRMRVQHGWSETEFVGGRAPTRKIGSYVYQTFVPCEGFELRLFVIGSSYVHAEARQQLPVNNLGDPSMSNASNAFTPVLLEASEKHLARKVALAFGLRTFNIFALRTQLSSTNSDVAADGKKRVREVFVHHIDVVNGGIPLTMAPGVIEDIAQSLLEEIKNHHGVEKSSPAVVQFVASMKRSLDNGEQPRQDRRRSFGSKEEDDGLSTLREDEAEDDEGDLSVAPTKFDSSNVDKPWTCQWPELTAVLAVFRHGDRTPKQKLKLKLEVDESIEDVRLFLGMICGWILGSSVGVQLVRSGPTKKYELRSNDQLERLLEMLQAVREVLQEKAEAKTAFAALRMKDVNLLVAACNILKKHDEIFAKLEVEKDCLKVNVKWGGELTRIGETQARNLGKKFREAQYSHEDMTQLHSSFRHDLKVHSSNEPRCAQTAAAFAQGLLNLQSVLGAIQVSFVRMDNLGRLDRLGTFVHSPLIFGAKDKIRKLLESGDPIDEEFESRVLGSPDWYVKVREELQNCRRDFGTVRAALEELAKSVINLESQLRKVSKDLGSSPWSAQKAEQKKLCEAMPIMHQRWDDIAKELLKEEPKIVPAEGVATILDNAKFELRHSIPVINAGGNYPEVVEAFEQVYSLSSRITSFAELGEYGTTPEEKFEIARTFLRPMLTKLRFDLRVASGAELGDEQEHFPRNNELYTRKGAEGSVQQVRSRLYFAHHSQMQTLVNLFMWAPQRDRFLTDAGKAFLSNMPLPLAYVCHLVLKLWRRPDALSVDDKYRVSIELSPGDEGSSVNDDAPVPVSTVLHPSICLRELDQFLSELLEAPAVVDSKPVIEDN